jgi:hypothetical protein
VTAVGHRSGPVDLPRAVQAPQQLGVQLVPHAGAGRRPDVDPFGLATENVAFAAAIHEVALERGLRLRIPR